MRRGALMRDYRFRAITGALELSLAESGDAPSLPEAVTGALVASLDVLGGEPPSEEAVWSLAVGDRQFLMRRLAAAVGPARTWQSAPCAACGDRFDVLVDLSTAPVREAGGGFPEVAVETSIGKVRARVPTGEDQRVIAAMEDGDAAERALVERSVGGPEAAAHLSSEDVERIEAALEEASPAVATSVLALCPSCGAENALALDPYECLRPSGRLLQEVHELASTYHWSERDILALPRARRRLYLSLVDRARGMAS